MGETVQTGGLVSFDYAKRKNVLQLDDKGKTDIRDAYKEADERKRKEKIKRIIFWVVLLLIVLGVIGYYVL